MLSFSNIKTKLTVIFIAIGLLPILIASIISAINTSSDVTDKVYNQLTAINQIKKHSIEKYFEERKGDMGVLVDIADTIEQQAFMKITAINTLKKAQLNDYITNNKTQLDLLANKPEVENAITDLVNVFSNKTQWQSSINNYDPLFKPLLELIGWSDFFLLSSKGTVIYSTARNSDLRLNLTNDLNNSGFYHVFKKAKAAENNEIFFSDLAPYEHSNNQPTAFAIKAVFSNTKLIGYIAFQQPLEKVNQILGNRVGMGKTGESYLVGEDRLMRSDSYLNPKQYSVSASFEQNNTVETVAAINALKGKSGTSVIVDYNNNLVVSSWDFIDISSDIRWGIISELDVAEAFNPKTSTNKDFYKSYIEKYGYYDLFLINPNGHIFYTVAQEADLNTNILTGKYASSNLGALIKEINQTKNYGFVDFAPYEPSNDEPAAFIAQPLLDNNGQPALYIALQLPLEGIQAIMGMRDGMGKTGESYLVGSDLKMRSNSFLDPAGHSVKASFAGTVNKNGVDTDATRRALAGENGTDIIADYNGNPVLSSFDNISLGNFNWAILSEIDEPEAFASIKSNNMFMAILMLISIVIISFIGALIAKRIANPISEIADIAQHVAKGDLTQIVTVTSNDEIGKLQEAIKQMLSNLSQMVKNIINVSIQQAATSEELAAITTQTSATVEEQQSISEQLATAMQEMGATVDEVAVSATTTSTAVDDIQLKVSDGSTKLNNTYNAILSMVEQIQKSEQSVQKLRTDFDHVVKILDVIKGVAEQTNLLALNAAIEAARAGDQGRGFAVVADEVRQLAQRTQDSTSEIDNVIKTILSGANSSVEVMANSVTQANVVQESAKEANELNKAIAHEMQLINDLSTQIATATEEQSVVVEQILQNVESLNTGVLETSHATSNIAESSVELANLASQLEQEASVFKVN